MGKDSTKKDLQEQPRCSKSNACIWLNENEIKSLEGLPILPMQKEFSISMNKIEVIRTGLDGLDSLKDLNMSGNRIGIF